MVDWIFVEPVNIWLLDYEVIVDVHVFFGRRDMGCLGYLHCFSTLEMCARVSCRNDRGFDIVTLAGIGGAFLGGIVLEVGEKISVFFG